MDYKSKKKTTILFSYLFSILIISPCIRSLTVYYNLSILFSALLSIIGVYFISEILELLDLNYNFVRKFLQNTFCQQYIFSFLYIENFIRKNTFFVGVAFFFCLDFILHESMQKLSFNRLWVLAFYYILIIYIKIRTSLVNHEVLGKKNEDFLSWKDFICFYKIKDKIKKNYNFTHITPFYIFSLKKQKSEACPRILVFSNSVCVSVSSNTKKTEKKVASNIKFALGFAIATILNFMFKQKFLEKKKNALYIKKYTVQQISEGLERIQKMLQEAEQKKDLDLKIQLNRDLIFWLKLQDKIENASFLYFFTDKSIKKAYWAGDAACHYIGPSLERYNDLQAFLNTFNLVNIFIFKNQTIPNKIIYPDDKALQNLAIMKEMLSKLDIPKT